MASGDSKLNDTKNDAVRAALERAKDTRALEKAESSIIEQLPDEVDWKKWPLKALVKMLRRIPSRGRRGEPDWYMNDEQAIILGLEAHINGLNPFAGEIYLPGKDSYRPGKSVAGKLKLARKDGYQFGVPQFTRDPTDYSKPLIAYICKLPVRVGGEREIAEYRAELAVWTRASDQWTKNPEHMLQVRALGHAMEWATGVGISDDFLAEAPADELVRWKPEPTITVQPQEFEPPPSAADSTDRTRARPKKE